MDYGLHPSEASSRDVSRCCRRITSPARGANSNAHPMLVLHSSAHPLRSAVNQSCWMQSTERQVHLQFMGVPFLARYEPSRSFSCLSLALLVDNANNLVIVAPNSSRRFEHHWQLRAQLQHRPPPCGLTQHHVTGHLITTGRLSLTLFR